MTLTEIVQRIQVDLTELGATYALVGGLAVSARTEPRFTRDADLAVAARDDAEAEALVYKLQERGYEVESVVEQHATGRLATVRLSRGSPAQSPVVDLLFASSGIEPDIVAGADRLELVEGLSLPIAQTAHLIALKVLARDDVERPQDIVDLRALLRVASASDLDEARRALEAIDARGFHRGRDLMAELDQLLA